MLNPAAAQCIVRFIPKRVIDSDALLGLIWTMLERAVTTADNVAIGAKIPLLLDIIPSQLDIFINLGFVAPTKQK